MIAKPTRTAVAMITPRTAIARRSLGAIWAAMPMNRAATPIGSIITNRVMNW